MLWFHNGCIHVAVWSGDSAVLWDYKDMLRSVAQHNHYKIDVVLTKSKEALLQSIRFFSKKPHLIIIADSLNSYQYRMFLEQLERRRSRAKVAGRVREDGNGCGTQGKTGTVSGTRNGLDKTQTIMGVI